jgi:hypothetical protein
MIYVVWSSGLGGGTAGSVGGAGGETPPSPAPEALSPRGDRLVEPGV